jgi:predicted nucleotidyltransferase
MRPVINPTLQEVENSLVPFFQDREEILLASLFGSYITTLTRVPEDLDVALLVNPELLRLLDRKASYGYQAELTTAIMNRLKFNRVDLVLLHRAPPVLAYQVIHTGKAIFSRSEPLRRDFEIATLKRQADTRHLRRIKRHYSEKRMAQGLSAYD